MKIRKEIVKISFIKSIPILCSYIFLGTAYGIMMEEAGFAWYISSSISFIVYTGAFQFVLITFMSMGASLVTVIMTALLMSSRQSFYSLAFLEDFKKMGKRKWYMIYTMSDETFAVNTTLDKEMDTKDREDIMFLVAIFARSYWIVGSALGGLAGQLIPFDMKGIDYCMTALFVIIFIDKWEQAKNHKPAIIGMVVAIATLIIFGGDAFMLPALLITSALLLIFGNKKEGIHNE